jgi:hypothetical protein
MIQQLHKMLHGQQGLVKIEGSFAPNGSSALVSTDTNGKGFTVAYTSTGLYTVTLSKAYPQLIAAGCWVQLSAAADIKLQFGTIDVVTAKTLQIRSLAVATLTDIAANTNNRIHFSLTLRNTAVK